MEDERPNPAEAGSSAVDYAAMLVEAQAAPIPESVTSRFEAQIATPEAPTAFDPVERACELIQASKESGIGQKSISYRESYIKPNVGEFGVKTETDAETMQAEIIATAREQAEMRKSVSKISVRMSLETLKAVVIGNEPYQTIAETGTTSSEGSMLTTDRLKNYKNMRDEQERTTGMRQSDSEPFPVFAYLEEVDTVAERPIAAKYGDAEIILKDDVIQRSTFTTGDSLDTGYTPIEFEDAVYM